MSGYAELQVTSNFSFLRGGSHPEELINEAVRLELKGIALTDHNSLAGIVRAHLAAKNAAKESKLQYIVGCRLDLAYQRSLNRDSTAKIAVLVYPTGRESYGALCRLLSLGKLRAPKGECHLEVGDFLKESRDLVCVLVPPGADAGNTEELEFLNMAKFIKENLPDPRLLSLAISRSYSYLDRRRLTSICQAAEHLQIPLVVTNDVYYHATQRRPLQRPVSCSFKTASAALRARRRWRAFSKTCRRRSPGRSRSAR
ncbi:MAG: hypothetical protein DCC75_03795 [Proteobacteria bacterium]|nr:MAG: hypothetical protein DCC75_03795 [Pseudomonadota bacterium]